MADEFNSIITDIAPLNVQRPNGFIVVPTKQSDGGSRSFRAEMYNGTEPWNPGSDVKKTIRYRKPDGHAGWYDETEDKKPAVTINNNVVTFAMTEQALNVPGKVLVDLSFYQSIQGSESIRRISTFNIVLDVEPQPISDAAIIESKDYVSVMGKAFAAASALVGATAEANEDYDTPIDEGGVPAVRLEGGPDEGTPYKFVFDLPAGKRGPRGYKIMRIVPVSDSHTPGGFDTYKFKTEDGLDVEGTFQVYNGMNGIGAVNSVDGVQPNGTNIQLNALRVPQGSDQVQSLTTDQIGKIRKALGIGSMASYDYILPDGITGVTDNGLIFGEVTASQYNAIVNDIQSLTGRVSQVEAKSGNSIELANGNNLNDISYSGWHHAAANVTVTNAPASGEFYVQTIMSASGKAQMAITASGIKTRIGNGAWV